MVNRSKTKLIKIGNSRGIRIPKFVLDRLHLTEEIEMVIVDDHLELRPAQNPRKDWDGAFQSMAKRGDDRLIDEPTATKWDDEEWDW